MKNFSLVFLVCALLAVAMSQPVPEETPLKAEPEKIEERALRRPTIGEVADRFSSAVRLTVKDEREAIAKVVEEIIAAGRQIASAGSAAAMTGFRAAFVLPNLGRTMLIDTNIINRELARS